MTIADLINAHPGQFWLWSILLFLAIEHIGDKIEKGCKIIAKILD